MQVVRPSHVISTVRRRKEESYASRERRTKSVLPRVERGYRACRRITLAGGSVLYNRIFWWDGPAVGAVLDRFFQYGISSLGGRFTWSAECARNSLSWDPQQTGIAFGRCYRWQSQRVLVQ